MSTDTVPIDKIVSAQRRFFASNATKDVKFRIAQLKKFKSLLKQNESALYDAIYRDFGKSEFETYVTELALIYHEINCLVYEMKNDYQSSYEHHKKLIDLWNKNNALVDHSLGATLKYIAIGIDAITAQIAALFVAFL